jgi:hypothetical protein
MKPEHPMIARNTSRQSRKPKLSLAARVAATLEGAESHAFVTPERRSELISKYAYLRAAGRGFEPGRELEDWCQAEREIDTRIFRGDIPAN